MRQHDRDCLGYDARLQAATRDRKRLHYRCVSALRKLRHDDDREGRKRAHREVRDHSAVRLRSNNGLLIRPLHVDPGAATEV